MTSIVVVTGSASRTGEAVRVELTWPYGRCDGRERRGRHGCRLEAASSAGSQAGRDPGKGMPRANFDGKRQPIDFEVALGCLGGKSPAQILAPVLMRLLAGTAHADALASQRDDRGGHLEFVRRLAHGSFEIASDPRRDGLHKAY